MRILHLLATGMHGGAATAALTLARLQQQWEEVAFALPRRHSLDQEVVDLENAGVRVMPLDLKFQRRPSGWRAYLRSLRSGRFDVAHVHLPDPTTGVWPAIGARMAGIPLVVAHEHLPMASSPDQWTWKQRLGRKIMQRTVNRFLAVTGYSAQYLQHYCGISESSISVLHLGVDRMAFDTAPDREMARRALSIEESASVICIVGNLIDERKGHLVLFQAVREIHREIPSTCLLVVGGGTREAEYQQLAEDYDISGFCRFVGQVAHADVPNYVVASNVLAVPSLEEAFGLVALEAMTLGVPPVASAVGGLLDIVEDGVTGLLVPAGDSDALTDALLRLLSDTELATAMGVAAKQAVTDHWDANHLAKTQLGLYRDWLGPKHTQTAN
jgi:glycosyltransferase involved in cell wall biosynthesis